MITNVFGDALERIDPRAFLAALEVMSVETGRLEFKQHDVSREDVAKTVAAMANADGGIIAIGFFDPKKTNGDIRSSGTINISNDALTGWFSAVHARVHPPMNLEARGYEVPGGPTFLFSASLRTTMLPMSSWQITATASFQSVAVAPRAN